MTNKIDCTGQDLRPARFGRNAALVLILTLALPGFAKVQIAEKGVARCVIVTQPVARRAERYAGEGLAATLGGHD